MTEALDIEVRADLEEYLRRTARVSPGERLEIRNLAGGVSNRTVLVRRADGSAWVVKQALPKLRVAVDWFCDPARIEREALGMRWLAQLAPAGAVTRLIFEDPGQHLLAMEAVPQPHDNLKTLLLHGRIEADHIRQFAELLGTIHGRAWERRAELSGLFDDRRFFEALRLEPYYDYTAGQVTEAAAFLHDLTARTRCRRLTLVHGDYSPKNVLVHRGRLILLDHEVIHWGDPAFDLGFSLAHLLSKAHHLREHRDRFARAAVEYWQAYAAALGAVPWRGDLEPEAVRQTLGCLLARVAGRSPLEYLDAQSRSRQREAVVTLMSRPPATVTDLTREFLDLA